MNTIRQQQRYLDLVLETGWLQSCVYTYYIKEEAAVKMFVFVKDGVSLWSRMAMIATGTSAIMLSIIKRLEKTKTSRA